MIGHGFRDRQLRGPPEAAGAPVTRVLRVRRFLCQRCGAVVVVVPREVLPRRHYSASAIGFAFALFGLLGISGRAVRTRIAGGDGFWSWPTLRRWIDAAKILFVRLGPMPATSSRRERAARAAGFLASFAIEAREVAAQAFEGAARAA